MTQRFWIVNGDLKILTDGYTDFKGRSFGILCQNYVDMLLLAFWLSLCSVSFYCNAFDVANKQNKIKKHYKRVEIKNNINTRMMTSP